MVNDRFGSEFFLLPIDFLDPPSHLLIIKFLIFSVGGYDFMKQLASPFKERCFIGPLGAQDYCYCLFHAGNELNFLSERVDELLHEAFDHIF